MEGLQLANKIVQYSDLADAQQIKKVTMAAGVFLHPFMGINEQQRRLGIGRAGDHVFQKLLVAGRVNDDVLALFGLKPNYGYLLDQFPIVLAGRES